MNYYPLLLNVVVASTNCHVDNANNLKENSNIYNQPSTTQYDSEINRNYIEEIHRKKI